MVISGRFFPEHLALLFTVFFIHIAQVPILDFYCLSRKQGLQYIVHVEYILCRGMCSAYYIEEKDDG